MLPPSAENCPLGLVSAAKDCCSGLFIFWAGDKQAKSAPFEYLPTELGALSASKRWTNVGHLQQSGQFAPICPNVCPPMQLCGLPRSRAGRRFVPAERRVNASANRKAADWGSLREGRVINVINAPSVIKVINVLRLLRDCLQLLSPRNCSSSSGWKLADFPARISSRLCVRPACGISFAKRDRKRNRNEAEKEAETRNWKTFS